MGAASILLTVGIAIGIAAASVISYLTNMPGRNQKQGTLAPLTAHELRIQASLQRDVEMLAGAIGGRSAGKPEGLRRALDYLETRLREEGYTTERQSYEAEGQTFVNLEAAITGASAEAVVVGAHYDTAGGLPGANDNASGCAAVLALAREFAGAKLERQVRWVLFANEEPPWFQTPKMGSYVYAERCRTRGDKISGMVSLETIGYYSDREGSQTYPLGFHPGYPDRGDFLGFVSDIGSAGLLRRVVKNFRHGTSLPSQGAAVPAGVAGVGWSDHWAFWQFGYRAVMVTDTAPFRYPYYHSAEDTPDKLDYQRMARAVTGLAAAIRELAGDHGKGD